jgi:hypothetical protein
MAPAKVGHCICDASPIPWFSLNDRNRVNKRAWGLLQRRECLLPTLRGWLLLGSTVILLCVVTIRNIHPFLAITAPVPGGALVVEGWATDYALQEAITEFKKHDYRKLYVTGGPLQVGEALAEYKTHAELGAARLLRMGLDKDAVQAVPAPLVRQDRTYASAIALRNWLRGHNATPDHINVITIGTHARRSRLMFEKAFADGLPVGIVAIEDRAYDAQRWWTSSNGVKAVMGEVLSYGYTRLFFRPPAEPSLVPTSP